MVLGTQEASVAVLEIECANGWTKKIKGNLLCMHLGESLLRVNIDHMHHHRFSNTGPCMVHVNQVYPTSGARHVKSSTPALRQFASGLREK